MERETVDIKWRNADSPPGGSWFTFDPVVHPVAAALQRQSRLHADEPMVDDGTTLLRFAEVADLASRLATRVTEIADGPVMVLADRNVLSSAALMGVAWAGRGVIPMSVDDPPSRLREIADRVGDPIVVDGTGRGPSRLGTHPVLPTAEWTAVDSGIPPQLCDPNALGTILFTSGSTGRPKGVTRRMWQEHAAVVRGAQFVRPFGRDRSALFSPFNWLGGFDALRKLAFGRFAWTVDPLSMSPRDLLDEIDRRNLTTLQLTPSLLASLAAAGTNGRRYDSVVNVQLIGEATDWSLIGAARELFSPDVVVAVGLGASEMIGFVTYGFIDRDVTLGHGPIPLGPPLEPAMVRLDPVDHSGDRYELVIRDLVSDGYWDDPELDRQRFSTAPDGVREWRSGDVVAVDERGWLHHRGRLDDMVKVNGRLVEPSEATAALVSHPSIGAVAVLPRQLPSGRWQLVAHLEAEPGAEFAETRRWLSERLPPHLIPGVFVRHDSLPLTDRGKVDRQALMRQPIHPWRDRERKEESATALEASMLVEARSILDVADLSLDDDLFHIGLDSLGALELMDAIETATGLPVDMTLLARHGTLRGLATALLDGRTDRSSSVIMGSDPTTGRPTLLCVGAAAPAHLYRELVDELGPGYSVLAVEQAGLHSDDEPDRSLNEAVDRAERLLTSTWRLEDLDGPLLLIGHSFGGLIANELAHRLERRGVGTRLVLLDAARLDAPRLAELARIEEIPPSTVIANLRHGTGPTWRRRIRRLVPACLLRLHRERRRQRRVDELLDQLGSAETLTHRYNTFFHLAYAVSAGVPLHSHHQPTLVVHCRSSLATREWVHLDDVTYVEVGGDHVTMIQRPFVVELVDSLRKWLAKGSGPAGSSLDSGQQVSDPR